MTESRGTTSSSVSGATRRHPLAKCEECSLFNKDSVFVPSQPPLSGHTKLVLVGEAPGVQEARTGQPFTGPSGKLLNMVLSGHDIHRQDTFITNACLCRPRNNATPSNKDVWACSERLRAEVTEQTKDGAAIVAMGNTAASAIFDKKVTITSFRVGPAKESPLYPGVKAIPTVHPAYVLRMADAFPMFVDDIGKVKSNIDVHWEPPKAKAFEKPETAIEAMREIQRLRTTDVVVDIEVGMEKDIEFIHPDQYNLLCVGLGYMPGKAIVVGEQALKDPQVRAEVGKTLESKRVVAHNGKFDLAGLRRLTNARLGFDTMLASYVCDERRGTHGLKYLAVEKLGAPQYDLEIHRHIRKGENFAHVPRSVLYKYNAYDVACTWLLKDMYEEVMPQQDLTRVHDMLIRGSNMLMDAEMRGIDVDVDFVNVLDVELETIINDLEQRLRKWVGNPRSPLQVKAALLDLGVRVGSTAVDVLQEVLRRYNSMTQVSEFVNLILEHRRASKMRSTYVQGVLRRLYNGRVHPTFLLHGTTTGRLACRNPNLQNVPRESNMRRMFRAAEGKTFVQADYKSAELRVIACEARDRYLKGLFEQGRDIHSEVALQFFGPNFTKDQRVRAKAVVFGLSYGREEYSLAKEFNIPVHEAKRYLTTFFSMIPDTVAWRDDIQHQVLHGEDDLVTAFGRHRRVWLVTEDNKHEVVKESLAFKPQSTASDICLNAAVELHEKYGLDIRLLVHDSILVETDQPQEVKQLMEEVMPRVAAELYSDYVPFPVDVSIGDSWGDL